MGERRQNLDADVHGMLGREHVFRATESRQHDSERFAVHVLHREVAAFVVSPTSRTWGPVGVRDQSSDARFLEKLFDETAILATRADSL